MVAGSHPPGYPLDLTPKRDAPDNQLGRSECDRVDRMTQLVFGHDVRFHPITELPLQNSGQPDDEQALTIHLPLIAQRDGLAAAQAMHAKLTKAPPEVIAAAAAEAQGKTAH